MFSEDKLPNSAKVFNEDTLSVITFAISAPSVVLYKRCHSPMRPEYINWKCQPATGRVDSAAQFPLKRTNEPSRPPSTPLTFHK